MWYDDYQKLGDRDKEQFTRLVNLLFARTFLLRERVEPKDKSIVIDRDYRYLEHNFSLVQGYLALAGWELTLDPYLGVAALSNRSGTNRYRLNKFETYFLLVLRLIYLEESEKLTLRKDVITSVRNLLEKMSLLNLLERKLPDKSINEGLSTLKEFNLIDRVGDEWKHPETKIIIYPSVLLAVTAEQIQYLYERQQEWDNPQEGAAEFNETT
ncbi:MAG: DUF4194 domain-containing protein [Desulfosporosinus sp.]|nr:DUF4194 domain-containing protein [Desulfosporosinus sp.]